MEILISKKAMFDFSTESEKLAKDIFGEIDIDYKSLCLDFIKIHSSDKDEIRAINRYALAILINCAYEQSLKQQFIADMEMEHSKNETRQ